VRTLANIWGIPEPKLSAVLMDTVHHAMSNWPELLPVLPLSDVQRESVIAHIDKNPSLIAWCRRARQKSLMKLD
jgi:serine/threonine-protein kinase HipA